MTAESSGSQWKRTRLVSLCSAHVDCVNRTAPLAEHPTACKMLRTTNVRNGSIDTENVRYVSEETFKRWTRRLTPLYGDVVLTREAPLGEVGMIRTHEPVFLGQRLYHFRADPQRLDGRFLLYALLGPDLQSQIRSFGSGSTVEHMRLEDIELLEICVPDLAAQRDIAELLGAYDDLIENNLRRIRILEDMARAIYREWFVHFRFPGHEGVAMVESELGLVPDGWASRVAKIATLLRDTIAPANFPDEEFEHFSIPAFDASCRPSVELGASILSNKYLVAERAVLVSKLNPRIPRVWLAQPSGSLRPIASTEFLVLAPRRPEFRSLLYSALTAEETRGKLAGLAVGTSTSHQRVKAEDMLGLPIVRPSLSVLREFDRIVSPMLLLASTLRDENANLRTPRDLLLPRLMSGQLTLAEAEAAV